MLFRSASKELIAYIEDTIHAGYLFRLRSKFNNTIDAIPAPTDQYGTTDHILVLDDRKVRVLKFYLPSGTLETLITNDFGLVKDLFRQCYFLRWPVEEDYKLIKEKIGLTNFRGYSENSVLQEFWISILLANLTLAHPSICITYLFLLSLHKVTFTHFSSCINSTLCL